MASNGYVQFDPAVIEQARQIDLLSYLQRYEPSNLKRVVIPKVGLSRNLIFQPVSMPVPSKKFGITFPPF